MQIDHEKLKWIKDNPHICISPWIIASLLIDDDGNLVRKPCCNMKVTEPIEPFSTKIIDKMKKTMMEGKVPVECELCTKEEAKGLQSERIRYLLSHNFENLKKFEQTFKMDYFMLGAKFGILCNLACRSCNSFNSSLWSKIFEVPSVNTDKDIADMPEYWEALEKICEEEFIEKNEITFLPMGGETMVQEGFQKTLEWLIEKEYNKRISSIYLTTNLTTLKKNMLDLFDQFKSVEFSGSIDSVGKNYHYVRWPGQFSTIEKNLETIVKLLQKNDEIGHKKYIFRIVITWSLNNIWHINEILDYWHNWMLNNNTDIVIESINLHRPEFLVIDSIPNPYRDILIEIVDKAIAHPIFSNEKREITQTYLYNLKLALQNQSLIDEKQFLDYLYRTADADLRNDVRMKDYNNLHNLLTEEHRTVLDKFYNTKNFTWSSFGNHDS